MAQTLLEKAKATTPDGRSGTTVNADEEVDLMLAFIRGEVNVRQVGAATGMKRANIHSHAAIVIRRAIMGGQITIAKKGE